MSTWIVIPARMGSSRFPGKPLAPIAGAPMIVRVLERALGCAGIDRVLVATDDPAIAEIAASVGAQPVLTGPAPSGTHRVAEAVRIAGSAPDHVVNVQGDQPLLDPRHVAALLELLRAGAEIATLCAPLTGDPADPHRVKVVASGGRAWWFSRAPIPSGGPWRQHVGIYGFRPDALDRAVAAPRSVAAPGEDLEQLAWLEAGLPIAIAEVADAPPSVDVPGDIRAVERLLRR